MDATYSKVIKLYSSCLLPAHWMMQLDRVDSLYLAKSTRIDVKEETRIKADAGEVGEWIKEVQAEGGLCDELIQDQRN